jgi:glycosyltransferase involved in cell wall biosynthesis
MSQTDVSVVLNIHREGLFLRPTLYSLNNCAAEAVKHGIKVELIAVFDRVDAATLAVFQTTTLSSFAAKKTIEIDVGSLGLARNVGVDMAEGEYIWTADGDDLLSRNAIYRLLQTARNQSYKDVAVFMEYFVAFGDNYHVARYFGSELLTAADFAIQHPLGSRIFIRRAILKDVRYRDLKVTTGFAYEDWDLNCRLLAFNFIFLVAQDTILFYRQRENSLLRQANAISARLIPHSSLFERSKFREQMARARSEHQNWDEYLTARRQLHNRNFAKELLASEKLTGYVMESALLEPEIEPQRIQNVGSYCPVPKGGRHWGFWLERLYDLIGNSTFTDVVLMPWLRPGGAEKYILQILGQLQNSGISERIIVLSGQSANKHEWVSLLPAGSVFVDLFNAFPSLSDFDRVSLAVRGILAVTAEGGRMHLKPSVFAHNVMKHFGGALSTQLRVVYYRFCDDNYIWKQYRLACSWGVKFLRQHLPYINLLISDCYSTVENDLAIIGAHDSKYHVIYTHCGIRQQIDTSGGPHKRLLWASRVASQKRPELLRMLAAALLQNKPDLIIEVFGQIEVPYSEGFFDAPGVSYRGSFKSFSDLPVDRYDALLYTSAFDGLPNIILEAMGAGLPVIAPDVGGIKEAVVDQETGYLVPDIVDESDLVAAYVKGVDYLYANWERTLSLREGARRLIYERHGQEAFAQRVAQVFSPTDRMG